MLSKITCKVSVCQCNVRTQEILAITIFIAMINTNVIYFFSLGIEPRVLYILDKNITSWYYYTISSAAAIASLSPSFLLILR